MKLWHTAAKLLTLALLVSISAGSRDPTIISSPPAEQPSSTLKHSVNHAKGDVTLIERLAQKTSGQNGLIDNLDGSDMTVDVSSVSELDMNTVAAEKKGEESTNVKKAANGKTWFELNRNKILNALLVVVGLALLGLIVYKYYAINQSIKEQHAQIQSYANQLETIIEGSDKLVFATWKDQQENIRFVDNPAYKKRTEGELSKTQQIEAEIARVAADIERKNKDVAHLREKETVYDDEIAQLEVELAEARTMVLDEGAALGFADAVLREFK